MTGHVLLVLLVTKLFKQCQLLLTLLLQFTEEFKSVTFKLNFQYFCSIWHVLCLEITYWIDNRRTSYYYNSFEVVNGTLVSVEVSSIVPKRIHFSELLLRFSNYMWLVHCQLNILLFVITAWRRPWATYFCCFCIAYGSYFNESLWVLY